MFHLLHSNLQLVFLKKVHRDILVWLKLKNDRKQVQFFPLSLLQEEKNPCMFTRPQVYKGAVDQGIPGIAGHGRLRKYHIADLSDQDQL